MCIYRRHAWCTYVVDFGAGDVWLDEHMGLSYQRQKCGQWTVISEHMRFVWFFTGVYCRGATNRSWATKLSYSFTLCSIISQISWDVRLSYDTKTVAWTLHVTQRFEHHELASENNVRKTNIVGNQNTTRRQIVCQVYRVTNVDKRTVIVNTETLCTICDQLVSVRTTHVTAQTNREQHEKTPR